MSATIRPAGRDDALFQLVPELTGRVAARARRGAQTCAKTRKLGRARGTSKNSGLRQPSSSPRVS